MFDKLKKKINKNRRWIVLVIVALGLMLVTLDNSILYTALPRLTEALGASHSEALWIINAYPLVMAGLLLATGTLGDKIGHRRLFVVGLIIFGLSSILAAFSPTAGVLIAARALLAVGAAAMMPATLALIRLTFHKKREFNMAIAIWGSIAVVGAALGPIIGGLLLEWFWWGSVFLVNVPFVLIALVGTFMFAPIGKANSNKPWDLVSSLQFMIGLTGLVLFIKEVTKPGASVALVSVSAIVAAVGLYLFVRRQRHMKHPTLDLKIFRNPVVLAGVFGSSVAMFALAGIQLIITQRFQLVADFTPIQAGLLVVTAGVGSMVSSLIGGAILHKVGLRSLISGGLALTAIGIALTVGFFPGVPMMIVGLVVVGLGLGFVMSVASTAILGSIPHHEAGMASSVEEVSYELGGLTAVALLGSLVTSIYSSSIELPAIAPTVAGEGINEAIAVAKENPEFSESLLRAAGDAYDTGFIGVMIVMTIIVAIFAVVTNYLLRKHGAGSEVIEH